jgi:hypothetical protein
MFVQVDKLEGQRVHFVKCMVLKLEDGKGEMVPATVTPGWLNIQSFATHTASLSLGRALDQVDSNSNR